MFKGSRFYRWLKCRHDWEYYNMSDALLLGLNVKVYEPMRYDAKGVIICRKCSELRLVGRDSRVIW